MAGLATGLQVWPSSPATELRQWSMRLRYAKASVSKGLVAIWYTLPPTGPPNRVPRPEHSAGGGARRGLRHGLGRRHLIGIRALTHAGGGLLATF